MASATADSGLLPVGKMKKGRERYGPLKGEKDKVKLERQEFLFIIETVACFPRLMFHYALVCCQSVPLA